MTVFVEASYLATRVVVARPWHVHEYKEFHSTLRGKEEAVS